MALSLSSLLSMGNGALFASQAAIQTTGNNISNVNTAGYSRQAVALAERTSIDFRPGQIGQGVQATEVYRYFNRFVESAYLDKSTLQKRYESQHDLMSRVETVFNESNKSGISTAMTAMFKAWSTLAQEPDSLAARAALLEHSHTFTNAVRNADQTLADLEEQMNSMISSDVNRANELIQQIADLNREISIHTITNQNNANSMMDERDRKTRELATILDIKVQDSGGGEYMITTGGGMRLVQNDIPFSLKMQGPLAENHLVRTSEYNGTVGFDGKDGFEYTIEVVQGGSIDNTGSNTPAAGTAQYRVSLDGGRTWLKDDNGNDKLFYATDEEHSAKVKDLDVFFTGTNQLTTGDRFLVLPKSDVFWVTPTTNPITISTQVFPDGTDNNLRITGGTLGGYLEFRDRRIGEYRDQLASFTATMTWEINRIHSQGAGLTPMSSALGDVQVGRTDVALNSASADFAWGSRLQEGNVSFAIYDSTTGAPVLPYPGIDVFSPDNFDPSVHSLEDVVNAINAGPASTYMTASIVDNRLQITSQPGYEFSVTADTTGLVAGLGINTFFAGTSPASLGVRTELSSDYNLINAGRVNGAGEINAGDNITAQALADLASKMVEFNTIGRSPMRQTMTDFYATLVARVGGETASVGFTAATERTMAQELYNRREEISGVNLDEEMSNLIKFQSTYKAAAKLITTADQMLQTILSLKQ